eukprot:946555-Pelagomonas_calceolata.AAC.4
MPISWSPYKNGKIMCMVMAMVMMVMMVERDPKALPAGGYFPFRVPLGAGIKQVPESYNKLVKNLPADPIEQSKARLELQGSKRSKLQALLSEAQDAYRDALAEISKSWESQAADRAFMIVQDGKADSPTRCCEPLREGFLAPTKDPAQCLLCLVLILWLIIPVHQLTSRLAPAQKVAMLSYCAAFSEVKWGILSFPDRSSWQWCLECPRWRPTC